MKKSLIFIFAAVLAYAFIQDQGLPVPGGASTAQNAETTLEHAFNNQQSDIQVQGQGRVVKVLRDDLEGSRHQKFLLQLGSGQTLLISHNIDLAPRINNLGTGDTVEFHGEYEWNSKGGVIHWTHHDPAGRHVGGWLKHRGKTYQ